MDVLTGSSGDKERVRFSPGMSEETAVEEAAMQLGSEREKRVSQAEAGGRQPSDLR